VGFIRFPGALHAALKHLIELYVTNSVLESSFARRIDTIVLIGCGLHKHRNRYHISLTAAGKHRTLIAERGTKLTEVVVGSKVWFERDIGKGELTRAFPSTQLLPERKVGMTEQHEPGLRGRHHRTESLDR
jgi:hypothetical protein